MGNKINVAEILRISRKELSCTTYYAIQTQSQIKSTQQTLVLIQNVHQLMKQAVLFCLIIQNQVQKNAGLQAYGFSFLLRICVTGASSPGRRAICLSIVVDFSAFSKNGHLMIIQSSTDAILIAGMVTKTYQMQKQLSLTSQKTILPMDMSERLKENQVAY